MGFAVVQLIASNNHQFISSKLNVITMMNVFYIVQRKNHAQIQF